eukprot:353651-Chlamydomonas_euryale.AAC.9
MPGADTVDVPRRQPARRHARARARARALDSACLLQALASLRQDAVARDQAGRVSDAAEAESTERDRMAGHRRACWRMLARRVAMMPAVTMRLAARWIVGGLTRKELSRASCQQPHAAFQAAEHGGLHASRHAAAQTAERSDTHAAGHADAQAAGHADAKAAGHADAHAAGHAGAHEAGHAGDDEAGHAGDDEAGHAGDDEAGHAGDDEAGHADDDEAGHAGAYAAGHAGAHAMSHASADAAEHAGVQEAEAAGAHEAGHRGADVVGHVGTPATRHACTQGWQHAAVHVARHAPAPAAAPVADAPAHAAPPCVHEQPSSVADKQLVASAPLDWLQPVWPLLDRDSKHVLRLASRGIRCAVDRLVSEVELSEHDVQRLLEAPQCLVWPHLSSVDVCLMDPARVRGDGGRGPSSGTAGVSSGKGCSPGTCTAPGAPLGMRPAPEQQPPGDAADTLRCLAGALLGGGALASRLRHVASLSLSLDAVFHFNHKLSGAALLYYCTHQGSGWGARSARRAFEQAALAALAGVLAGLPAATPSLRSLRLVLHVWDHHTLDLEALEALPHLRHLDVVMSNGRLTGTFPIVSSAVCGVAGRGETAHGRLWCGRTRGSCSWPSEVWQDEGELLMAVCCVAGRGGAAHG